jgi:hypothetical protein
MTPDLLCFAASEDKWAYGILHDWISLDRDVLIIICALVFVTACIFIWAAFFRKPRTHPHHRFRNRPQESLPDGAAGKWTFSRLFFRKRHRRRHRERPRNPTLAEAGGLPPIRSEEQPPRPP